MASTLSPNMSLIVPTVGQEPGPQYASDVNASLTLIDQHDHSPGRGVQITPAGMDINAALDFNENSALNINTITLSPLPSASLLLQSLSAAPGGGTGLEDLWYTDGTGTPIQITKSGLVNVVASSIPGESYAGGFFIWDQTQSGAPTTPANFDIGSIILRPNVALTTFGVELSPPSSIASSYTLLLPSDPATNTVITGNGNAPAFVTETIAGQLEGAVSTNLGITAGMLAPNSVTTSKILDANVTAAKLAPDAKAGFQWQSQTFTSNGSFTVPSAVSQLFVTAAGGGGGGGCGGVANPGAAGGSASHPTMFACTVTPAQVISVTIGAAGAGSASVNTPGQNGQDTLFGSLLTFRGGKGGTSGNQQGMPVIGSWNSNIGGAGGQTILPGTIGSNGNDSTYALGGTGGSAGSGGSGGGGGAAGFGAGAHGGTGSASGAAGGGGSNAGVNTSAGGGGGGGTDSSPSPGGGGNGGSGQLIVYWLTAL